MRAQPTLAALLALLAAGTLLPGPAAAAEPERNTPSVASLRLRMGMIGQVFLYPPTVPMTMGQSAVLFFSGDWGWRPVQQEAASWLANHGRYVVGIDSTEYFSRRLDTPEWNRDLKTLRAFVNQKAGLPAETPVLLVGFTWGAEMVPYMLNRGGADGFAGALLIGPDEDGACVFRVALQMQSHGIPVPADEEFRVADELRRMAPIPTVFMQGELDTESRAATLADLARGPHKVVTVPGADRQFRDAREIYLSFVDQALAWIESARAPVTPGTPAPSR